MNNNKRISCFLPAGFVAYNTFNAAVQSGRWPYLSLCTMLLWHSPQWDMEISPLTFGWASSLWLSWSVWHLPLYLSRYCSLFSCTFSIIYFVIVISHVRSFTSCQFYYHKCCIVRINSQQLTEFNGNVFWLFIFKVIKVF